MSARTQASAPRRAVALDGIAPYDVAAALQHLPGLAFLDSAGHFAADSAGPLSIIAARPLRILRGQIDSLADRATLRSALRSEAPPATDLGIPAGGCCGWISYEGDFVFGDYPEILVYRHADATWWETGTLSRELQFSHGDPSASKVAHAATSTGPWNARSSRAEFISLVHDAKEWIAAGDIYQVNLSQAFTCAGSPGNLFPLYRHLRDCSPAPMAAWLNLDGRQILSSSPESFLRIHGRAIETRPIKGTRPRFRDADRDRRSAYELQTSAKEISELVMITDLLRNDLGQICETGSVSVPHMLQLESLAQVHHLVSTVTGTLRPEIDAIGAIAACFPGGSITGAPKIRAMEIIRQLERHPRGIYCGAIGWLGNQGEAHFNIAIRTLIADATSMTYQVGAGIVADSDSAAEYQETLHKAAGLRAAIERWHATR